MRKFECKLTKDELYYYYIEKDYTISQMCEIVGCKSKITMSKILLSNGIDTNNNKRVALKTRKNMSDEEFKNWLMIEYLGKMRSMSNIAQELNVSPIIISRYLIKYGISKRTKSEQQRGERSPGWNGGKHLCSNGYIEILIPNYPKKNKRGYVYEHVYVAEQKIGRLLKDNEVVHHIDRDKTNNHPDNLLVLTKEEHTKLHIKNGDFVNKRR